MESGTNVEVIDFLQVRNDNDITTDYGSEISELLDR